MRENFLDIVEHIVRQISEGERMGMKGRNILEGLFAEGYDPLDIEDALNWFENLSGPVEDLGGNELWDGFSGVRVQSPVEREVLSPDAFAYLSRLHLVGIVSSQLREAVLDKVTELGMPGLGVDHLRALIGLVLYSRENMAPEDVFYLLGDQFSGGYTTN